MSLGQFERQEEERENNKGIGGGCCSIRLLMIILGIFLVFLLGSCLLGGLGVWGFFSRASEVLEVQP